MPDPYRVLWAESALADLEGILDYAMSRDGLPAAEHVNDLLVSASDRLEMLPRRCRIVPELRAAGIKEYRELLAGPSRICFRIHESDLVIVAVLDGRRDLEEIMLDRIRR